MERKKITVVETCPRDGWEHQPFVIPRETKMKYIKKMIAAGARKLDLVNFADPGKVPQMRDAAEVLQETERYIAEKHLNAECMSVAFDPAGLSRALAAGAKYVQYAFPASEELNKRWGQTIDECLENTRDFVQRAGSAKVRVGLLCALGSPFGDAVTIDRLKYICERALAAGVSAICLPDTAGLASPTHVRNVITELKKHVDISLLGVHLHNAYGMGLANAWAAVEEGITTVEGALGGLGGGPFEFIPSNNNLASEDIVNLLESCGYDTGYDLAKMIAAANDMCKDTGAVHSGSLFDKNDCLLCTRN